MGFLKKEHPKVERTRGEPRAVKARIVEKMEAEREEKEEKEEKEDRRRPEKASRPLEGWADPSGRRGDSGRRRQTTTGMLAIRLSSA